MRRWVRTAALIAGCTAGASAQERPVDWRRLATGADRARLRDWRDAWVEASAKAQASGKGRTVAAEGALLDPDHALARPLPPPGDYRCRVIKLGARVKGRDDLRVLPAVDCTVAAVEDAVQFRLRGGAQRAAGELFADGRTRGVFLGTLVLGDERRAMAYGRDAGRDMAGVVERVGERRWRIVLPYPRFESLLDVIELTPA